ncbi:LacI family DNA-binding transcriptional regulator [Microbacterium sp. DT81.1]|uniref:LacI family DNA-binding transcriptional regulator n=1 Tax=Microbacterium sp. DT81.1 TaxID=3393413 RepID=UPI003CE73E5C
MTLATIAAATGVSVTTISKVLNGRGDVAASTRILVEDQLERLGYARRGESRSEFIEVVLHELDSNWSLEVIEGVRDVAASSGRTISLSVNGDRYAPTEGWIIDVVRRRPIGVVLVFAGLPPSARRTLQARGIPFVILDPTGDPAPDVPGIGSANWQGGVLATRHLIELGHRVIGAIMGPDDMMSSLARIDGFRSAMSSASLEVHPEWERFGEVNVESGEQIAGEVLAMPETPTAIFAGSDLQAMGVVRAARLRGLDVPRDLSVVGYDDIPLASISTPRLTTVHQPLRRMAEEATRLLLRMRGGEEPATTRIDLAPTLVVRESTAPPDHPLHPSFTTS